MKKLFAILMIVMMVVCYMPTVAFADAAGDKLFNELNADVVSGRCVKAYEKYFDTKTNLGDRHTTVDIFCQKVGGSITTVSSCCGVFC